jgi:hypothetical protein
MVKKILIVILGVSFSLTSLSHTLLVEGKKTGHNTTMRMVYHYVWEAGYDSTGVFMIRFLNGEEISLGKRSHWEKFRASWVHDDDLIIY